MDLNHLPPFLIFLSLFIDKGKPHCYFSSDFQGNFTTQVPYDDFADVEESDHLDSHYSHVTIELDRIPVWGQCHRKLGENFILIESSGKEEFCYRCFRIKVRSYSILQLQTKTLNRCFTREEMAIASCPSGIHIHSKHSKELILFRDEIQKSTRDTVNPFSTYCPFVNGVYSFAYSKTDYRVGEINPGLTATSNRPRQEYETLDTVTSYTECRGGSKHNKPISSISNCPKGHVISITFQKDTRCSSEVHEEKIRSSRQLGVNDFINEHISFTCLGDWASENTGERYVALLQNSSALEGQLRYRCALISMNENGETISMALSRDSTCRHGLHSSTKGFETFLLSPRLGKPWPSVVRKSSCMFPAWIEGEWNDVKIKGNTMVFKDRHRHLKTHTSVCVQQSFRHQNRYLIYSRTQCGEEEYNCVWFESRGHNIMEFQMGQRPSTTPSFELCDNSHFLQRTWNTQARTVNVVSISCPIKGEYIGVLPDAPQFCAKMSSDCNNPNIMFYSVNGCSKKSGIYDDREYQCFGQWEEDGLLYTFTKRRDLPNVYECFVGGNSMVKAETIYTNENKTNNRKISIIESGFNCKRGLNVNTFGMPLTKQSNCYGVTNIDEEHPWFVPTTHQYLYMEESNRSKTLWNHSTKGATEDGFHSGQDAPLSFRLSIIFSVAVIACQQIIIHSSKWVS